MNGFNKLPPSINTARLLRFDALLVCELAQIFAESTVLHRTYSAKEEGPISFLGFLDFEAKRSIFFTVSLHGSEVYIPSR
jgi:hypothetical protein